MAWQTLGDVEKEAMQCTKCSLHQGRTQVVWMDGNPDSDLMFIGEAPGFHEDRQGKPFVGAAGKLLDEMLAEIGLDRTKCTICNVLKCRPPNNRDPLPDEIEACRKWLDRQIELIDPPVIVTLGRHSMGKFIPGASISRIHGDPRVIDGRVIVPMFHPAAALHQERYRSLIVADFEKLTAILDAAQQRTRSAPPPEPQPAATPAVEQGRLF